MLFLSTAMYCNVICNTNCSRAFLKNKVRLLLENILASIQSKGKMGKSESPKWAVEGRKVRELFIQHYRPVTMTDIQLWKCCAAFEFVRDSSVKILWIEAYTPSPIGFLGLSYTWNPVSGLSHRLDHSQTDHFVKFLLNIIRYVNGGLPWGMYYRWYIWVRDNVVFTFKFANTIKSIRIQQLKVAFVLNCRVGYLGGAYTTVQFH